MNNRVYTFVLVLSVVGCARLKEVRQPNAQIGTRVTVLYQSCRFAHLEPCGCSSAPFGGIDRELNAVNRVKLVEPFVWYVDAGNLLAPKTLKGSVRANVNKAHKIVGILNMMGLDFFSPGPSDYLLGVKNLIQMQQKSLFKWVSSNVLDSNGKSLFSRFFIAEKAGLRFAFIGLSPKSKRPRSDIRVLDPVVAIKSILPRITRSADLIILLSQLPYIDNERLARAFPGISLIIGADPNFIYKTPYRITEKTLIVDSDGDGIVLGRLDLQVFLPFRGFYSFSDIRENRERLEFWQTHLKSHPRSKLARDMLRRVEDEGYTEAIENGSMFAGELIKLDEWRFGEKNSVSQRLAE